MGLYTFRNSSRPPVLAEALRVRQALLELRPRGLEDLAALLQGLHGREKPAAGAGDAGFLSLELQVYRYYILWALKYIDMTYFGLFGAPGFGIIRAPFKGFGVIQGRFRMVFMIM